MPRPAALASAPVLHPSAVIDDKPFHTGTDDATHASLPQPKSPVIEKTRIKAFHIYSDGRMKESNPYHEMNALFSYSKAKFGQVHFALLTTAPYLKSTDKGFEERRKAIREGNMPLHDQGRRYRFFGGSVSQLRMGQCFLWDEKGSGVSREQVLMDIGNFAHIRNPAKLYARHGQLFSSGYKSIDISANDISVEIIPDITSEDGNYIFTDGCGAVSAYVAWSMANEIGLEYVPSAFQIRCGGAKGMLLTTTTTYTDADDPYSERRQQQQQHTKSRGEKFIRFRKSMVKFMPVTGPLWILDWSPPRQGMRPVMEQLPCAKLNQQFVTQLVARGVEEGALWKLYQEVLDQVEMLLESPEGAKLALGLALRSLSDSERALLKRKESGKDYNVNRALRLLEAGCSPKEEPYLHSLILKHRESLLRGLQRCKFPVPMSTYAFGVADPYARTRQYEGLLDEGEVYFCGLEGRAWVLKSPANVPGDLRMVKMVNKPELGHLWGVIVFPMKGSRPLSDQIAGSDLDGDKYMICWDESLLPQTDEPPVSYIKANPVDKPGEISMEMLEDYFIDTVEQHLGTVGILSNYLQAVEDRAIQEGVSYDKCKAWQTLGRLLAQELDAPKTGQYVSPAEIRQYHNMRLPIYLEQPEQQKQRLGREADLERETLMSQMFRAADKKEISKCPDQADECLMQTFEKIKRHLPLALTLYRYWKMESVSIFERWPVNALETGENQNRVRAQQALDFEYVRGKLKGFKVTLVGQLESHLDERVDFASACYMVTYLGKERDTPTYSFPWTFCTHELLHLKRNTTHANGSKERVTLSLTCTNNAVISPTQQQQQQQTYSQTPTVTLPPCVHIHKGVVSAIDWEGDEKTEMILPWICDAGLDTGDYRTIGTAEKAAVVVDRVRGPSKTSTDSASASAAGFFFLEREGVPEVTWPIILRKEPHGTFNEKDIVTVGGGDDDRRVAIDGTCIGRIHAHTYVPREGKYRIVEKLAADDISAVLELGPLEPQEGPGC